MFILIACAINPLITLGFTQCWTEADTLEGGCTIALSRPPHYHTHYHTCTLYLRNVIAKVAVLMSFPFPSGLD